MTETQAGQVKAKLAEIHAEIDRHENAMKRLRWELIAHAAYFSSYGEMYAFIRANTPTLEDFNRDMRDALPVFLAAQERSRK